MDFQQTCPKFLGKQSTYLPLCQGREVSAFPPSLRVQCQHLSGLAMERLQGGTVLARTKLAGWLRRTE